MRHLRRCYIVCPELVKNLYRLIDLDLVPGQRIAELTPHH
jgi:hypothetical protein